MSLAKIEKACFWLFQESLNTQDLKEANWDGIRSSKEFETRYRELSKSGQKLKGKKWGEYLAEYAKRKPLRSDTQTERPILNQVRIGLATKNCNYDYQKETRTFNQETFHLVKRDNPVSQ